MSTNSRISIARVDGKIDSIYCHWGGYPDYVGRILLEHYNTEEKINELIALGSISSLNSKIKPDDGDEHNFDNPIGDVTVAYHRDRGEDLYIDHYVSMPDYDRKSQRLEFNYLWVDGKWTYNGSTQKNMVELTPNAYDE